ncbi:TerD family protein [Nocardia transvalensis]|uniref:TerD family protein n=1 Tax=Nocardia transvalensis TaxID=37333 RepID=UPI00189366C2|nr:TerD family protein [Nocardia transvalensis]MBF6328047.1 TerD family protein [Nocardia transvalensis]
MSIPLRDTSGRALDHVMFGLGWSPIERRRRFGRRTTEVDLNAAAVLCRGREPVEVVYHEQLGSADGAVRLHGDNLTGEGGGDDEAITVDLTRLSDSITTVVFLVTSYTGRPLNRVPAACRLVDGSSGAELHRLALSACPHTGMVVAALIRTADGWQFHPIAASVPARHPVDALPTLPSHLP